MFGVSLVNTIRNEVIRQRTNVVDVTRRISKLKLAVRWPFLLKNRYPMVKRSFDYDDSADVV